MNKKYSNLSRANLTYEYLHTNSTAHDFEFGALAELVDNSRDAEANNLYIYTEPTSEFRGEHILCFLDDGCGMSPNEAADIIKFGKSSKRSSDKNYIGQYGNGLKSGSMRIGTDLLLFTKKDNIGTVLLISDTFIRSERIEEIVVPIPSFDCRTKMPELDSELDVVSARERHDLEIEIIHKFTPYKNLESLFKQFEKIGSKGTLAMIYNLKVKEDGTTELDFETDPEDILIRNLLVDYGRQNQFEHRSLRAYLSILYADPRMKIYIQGKKVLTKLLERNLYMPRLFKFRSTKFKNRAIQEKEAAKAELKMAENDLREATSKLGDFAKRGQINKHPEYYTDLVRYRREKERCEKEVEQKKRLVEKRTKEVTEYKELNFIFGINIHNREADGLFIYNSSRLIIMFEHTRNQRKNSEYRGLVGIVNVPYVVSRPSHNKQTFTDATEQKDLIRVLGEYMDCYYNELKDGILGREFWRSLGYFTNNPEPPSPEEQYKKARIQRCKICLQCDKCLKWRILRFNPKLLDDSYYKDTWTCADNTDTSAIRCDVAENMEEFVQMEYRKIKETNFADIEKSTSIVPQAKPMSSQKTVTLVQKDHNETVNSSVPPPVTRALSEQHGLNRGSRSSVTESDSDTSLTGKRTVDVSKKKRIRDSDDENDPEFSLNGPRNKSKNRGSSKSIVTNKRSNTELSQTPIYNNNENEAAIKSEPDIAYENYVVGSKQNDQNQNSIELQQLKTIAMKHRELLNAVAIFSGEMPEFARDVPNYTLEELSSVSIDTFFDRFKESLVRLTAKKLKAKRSNAKKKLSTLLDNKNEVQISEEYKNTIMMSIDEALA